MNEKSRNIRKVYSLISKNRAFIALAGAVVAVVALFLPTFASLMGGGGDIHWDLYIYGVVRVWTVESGEIFLWNLHEIEVEWFASMISICTTIVVGAIVLATVAIFIHIWLKGRKREKFSSRWLLLTSFGLLATLIVFLLLMDFNAFESTHRTNWVGGHIYAWAVEPGAGAWVFTISSLLILAGYTVKIRLFLMYLALVAAMLVLFDSGLYLQRFFYYINTNTLDPIPSHIHAVLVRDHLVPGLNLLYISFAIVGADIITYSAFRVIKKRRNKNK